MSSNYELQTGNDWVPQIAVLFFNSFKTKTQPPADEIEKARQELYECTDKPENKGLFGCEFKTKDEVEKFCNSKSDCIGYIKGISKDYTTVFMPLKKNPVKLPDELKFEGFGQSIFFKKAGTMDKNTIYIIIGVVVLLILLGLFMFLKRRSNQDYQMYQDYQQPQDYAAEYTTQ